MKQRSIAAGGNPYLPLDQYVPDGEPRVFTYGGETRVYLYGSYDMEGYPYCGDCYHVFSAPIEDLTNWKNHGVSFAASDRWKADGIPNGLCCAEWEGSNVLYAPDCIQGADGRFYLYFCTADQKIGVAVSKTPWGPFTDATRLRFDTGETTVGIDPAVFVDGDGQGYLYWGQFSLQAAKLCGDMRTLDRASYVRGLITGPARDYTHPTEAERKFMFHEGSSMRKIGGKYYLIYCSIVTGRATSLAYAFGEKPLGPFRYGGVICDNTDLDPSSWNAHGSIAKIKEDYYIFFHASTGNSQAHRRARSERITVHPDGSIDRAENTSQGFLPALNPYALTPASYGCQLGGGCYFGSEKNGDATLYPLLRVTDGCFVLYRYYDFGPNHALLSLEVTVRSHTGGTLEIRQDSRNGAKLGEIVLSAGDGERWEKRKSTPFSVCGRQAMVLIFRGEPNGAEIADLLSGVFTLL